MTQTPADIWLVVPTYNESDNVAPLLAAVRRSVGPAVTVLFVDDASPDGTGEVAERLASGDEGVRVLHRAAKDGLGPAYLEGFRVALSGGARLVAQMDADLSHDPAHLPVLIDACEAADLVLGSRYVPGGGITEWGPIRRAVSRGGSLYARWVLGVPVRDLTGGFKCFRRQALEALDLPAVRSRGYAFQVEMTYRVIRAGLRVMEVPIVFRERRRGASKMSRAIVLEAAWRVPLLRFKARRRARFKT